MYYFYCSVYQSKDLFTSIHSESRLFQIVGKRHNMFIVKKVQTDYEEF